MKKHVYRNYHGYELETREIGGIIYFRMVEKSDHRKAFWVEGELTDLALAQGKIFRYVPEFKPCPICRAKNCDLARAAEEERRDSMKKKGPGLFMLLGDPPPNYNCY